MISEVPGGNLVDLIQRVEEGLQRIAMVHPDTYPSLTDELERHPELQDRIELHTSELVPRDQAWLFPKSLIVDPELGP